MQRTCAAADRTGHAILHTLYGQSLKQKAEFYIEYFATLEAVTFLMTDGRAMRRRGWRGNSMTARSTLFPAPR